MNKVTVITPCFNEAENVEECARLLSELFQNELPHLNYEHIFVDNASEDQTVHVLRKIAGENPRVKVIVNSRNVGPFRSMWFALQHATGDAIVPMLPADLQDPPEIIKEFIAGWEKGFLINYGIRKNRQENILMRMVRAFYYRLVNKLSPQEIPINAGEFMLIDRKVADSILETQDHYPYIRGLVAQTGLKSHAVEYVWAARKKGKSKNSLLDLIDQGINGFVSTGKALTRFSLLAGILIAFAGFAAAIFTFFSALQDRTSFQLGIPTLVISVFVFSGIQLIFLGIIGEYVLSIHGQVRKSPSVFAIEKINFPTKLQ